MIIYSTTGVCAKQINFKIDGSTLLDIDFIKGCPGSLVGIKELVKGLHIDEVISRLKGITCGNKSTSCPDQLARALEEYKSNTRK